MIYIFFGEDTFRSRKSFREKIDFFLNKKDQSFSFYWVSSEKFSPDFFEELSRTENLFGKKNLIVCEGILQEKDPVDFLRNNTKSLAESDNIFVFWEEKLELDILNIFKKYAEKIEEFNFLPPIKIKIWLDEEAKKKKITLPYELREDLVRQCCSNLWLLSSELEKYSLFSGKKYFSSGGKKENINLFHIADAVASRDRNQAWLLFQKAIMFGIDPEEIFWKLIWQIKNILIVKNLLPAPEKKIIEKTRLHPFVAKKSIAAARMYSEEELKKKSMELIRIYHDARRGLIDFDIGLEKFLIKI